MKIISLFSGCGGLDLGFKKAGFKSIWANEKNPSIWSTFEKNHPNTALEKKDIRKISSIDIPDCLGIIGGPPCQSWSTAGKGLGKKDPRGQLFFEFIRVVKDKQPLFFVAENVAGMLSEKHKETFEEIKVSMENAGYTVTIGLLNASDYNVPQDRIRFFFIGYRKDLNKIFNFPRKSSKHLTVKDAIWDIRKTAIPAKELNSTNADKCSLPNHEYWTGGYSYIFMSRNRVLTWDKPSYTIQADGRQVSLHPQAPKMTKVQKDVMEFNNNALELYRRLSMRECARLQTFPDDFIFDYAKLEHGYKMIGNAVPVNLAYAIAKKIKNDLSNVFKEYQNESISTIHGFVTTRGRSAQMKEIRSKATTAEILLQNEIKKLGFQFDLNVKELPGKPDIVFREKKLIVFIDGEFWHGYNWKEKKKKLKRNRNYWVQKIGNNIKRDSRHEVNLQKQGYTIIRFWDNAVKTNLENCMHKIKTQLTQVV